MARYAWIVPAVCCFAGLLAQGCGGGATDEGGRQLTPADAYQAAASGDLDIVMLCIENDVVDLNGQDAAGRTLLHHAAAGGQQEIVYWLIEDYRAELNIADNQGTTPLALARDNGHTAVAHMIERSGGN